MKIIIGLFVLTKRTIPNIKNHKIQISHTAINISAYKFGFAKTEIFVELPSEIIFAFILVAKEFLI